MKSRKLIFGILLFWGNTEKFWVWDKYFNWKDGEVAMLGEKRFDCQEMFCHACAFCECADMALKEYCHKSASIELYVVPAFVNSAFACEVFLKALLKYFDISYKNEHKLKALFEMLPMDLSCLIYLQVYSRCGKGWNMETLENLSDAFVRHRYIYEVDRRKTPIINYDTYSMTVFRNILREACCEIFFGITWRYIADEFTM